MKKVFLVIGFMFVLAGCGNEQVEEKKMDETSKKVEQKEEKKVEEKKEITKEEKETWKVFSANKFQAMFPEEPTSESTDVPVADGKLKIKMNSYAYETDDFIYIINTSDYPAGIGELSLEGALNGMAQSNGGNEIVSSSTLDFKGYKAMNYKLKNKADSNIILQGRIILVDQTMYQFMYGYTGEKNFDEESYNKFINSFELK